MQRWKAKDKPAATRSYLQPHADTGLATRTERPGTPMRQRQTTLQGSGQNTGGVLQTIKVTIQCVAEGQLRPLSTRRHSSGHSKTTYQAQQNYKERLLVRTRDRRTLPSCGRGRGVVPPRGSNLQRGRGHRAPLPTLQRRKTLAEAPGKHMQEVSKFVMGETADEHGMDK